MKKVVIYVWAKDYAGLADAVDHAVSMLRIDVPSENVTWEDDSHVDYTVCDMTDEEIEELKEIG